MEVKVCKNCRKLFNYMFGPEVCQVCAPVSSNEAEISLLAATLTPELTELEIKYRELRTYVVGHPQATIMQIAQAISVSATQILEWVREERLEFSVDCKYAWFTCGGCGVKISSGRYCVRCKKLKR